MIALIQNVIDGLSVGSLYALAAVGIGLLFGVLRLINFAHGDLITVGAYALIIPSPAWAATMGIGSWPTVVMIGAICGVVMLAALMSERLVFRPLRTANPATLMIASASVGFIIQHAILAIYGSRPKGVDLWSQLNNPIVIGSFHIPKLQVVTIGVTLLLMLSLSAFLKWTRFGVQMRAASEDFLMARYLGVKANLAISLAFAISGFLAATISLLFVSLTGTLKYDMGVPLMLYAFIATVIGGMGSLVGGVIGGFVVGLVSVMLHAYLPVDVRSFGEAFVFAFVVVILLLRPSGIIKTKALVQRV